MTFEQITVYTNKCYYFDVNTFLLKLIILLSGDVETNPGPDSLSCLPNNAHSLKTVTPIRNKFIQFQSLVNNHKPSIVAVTETWLTSEIGNSEILHSGYDIERRDREVSRGGGVLLAIDSSLNSRRRSDLECPDNLHNETIVCEISPSNIEKVALVVFYRPPNDVSIECLNNLNTVLNNIVTAGTQICLLGDFNLPYQYCNMFIDFAHFTQYMFSLRYTTTIITTLTRLVICLRSLAG